MRKFHSVLAAATLLGGGLVAGTTTTATAGPYTGTVDTTCQGRALNNPQEDGPPARIRFRVKVDGGNGAPRGKAIVKYYRRSNDDLVRTFRRDYDGPGYEQYSFGDVPEGRYRVEVRYKRKPAGSVYKNCSTSFRQRIR